MLDEMVLKAMKKLAMSLFVNIIVSLGKWQSLQKEGMVPCCGDPETKALRTQTQLFDGHVLFILKYTCASIRFPIERANGDLVAKKKKETERNELKTDSKVN